jgi:hypothetical protein
MGPQRELIAPCGLYCGVCRIRQATEADELGYLQRLVKVYARRIPELASATAEDLLCDGCQSARRSVFCRQCAIRDCAQQRGLVGCHQCGEFPCARIEAFPMPVGKKVILRAVPYWRKHGTEEWIRAEDERYCCPDCGATLFRGARQCPQCTSAVDVD